MTKYRVIPKPMFTMFETQVQNLLTKLGAVEDSETSYRYRLNTLGGPLDISLDTWEPRERFFSICSRFRDVGKAKEVLGDSQYGRLNPHSGKWNFLFVRENLENGDALRQFEMELLAVTGTKEN